MAKPMYSKGENNVVMRESDGVLFEYPFTCNGVAYWADATAFSSGAAMHGGALAFRLFTNKRKKTIERAEVVDNFKEIEGTNPGTCVSETDLAELPEPRRYGVAFELRQYLVTGDALTPGRAACKLPDGRTLALFHAPSGNVIAAGVIPSEEAPNAPAAELVNGAALATTRPGGSALALGGDDLALGAEEAAEEAARGRVVNTPITFVMPSIKQNDQGRIKELFSEFTCIPLVRFPVPEGFGKTEMDKNKKPRERCAYYVLVISPGAYGSNRDGKGFPIKPMTVCWVDEKPDVCDLALMLPRKRKPASRAELLTALEAELIKIPSIKKAGGDVAEEGARALARGEASPEFLASLSEEAMLLVYELQAVELGAEEIATRASVARISYLGLHDFERKTESGNEPGKVWRIELRQVRYVKAARQLAAVLQHSLTARVPRSAEEIDVLDVPTS